MSKSRIERFLEKVDQNGPLWNGTPCWIWTGVRNQKGYARFWNGQTLSTAHRYAYSYFVGPIPLGLTIDHLCQHRACVNAEHLEPVTLEENFRRSLKPGGQINAVKTHCPQGHPYDLINTIFAKRGDRECRTCKREFFHRFNPIRRDRRRQLKAAAGAI